MTAAEPDVMLQLIRLIVLYEDLKLEVAGLHVPHDKEFDEVSQHYREMYGCAVHATNNKMELTAVIEGLRALKQPCQVTIVTDSEYVRQGITEISAEPIEMVFIRAPIIERIGPDVSVLAKSGGQPVLIRQGRILIATFHPELTSDATVHEYFVGMASGAATGKIESPLEV